MCSGSKRKHSQTGFVMEGDCVRHEGLNNKFSVLLELSASNDLKGFKDAIEHKGHDVNEVGFWYGRRIGSKKIGYEERTPLMIAALFGSKDVLNYILGTGCVDVNQTYGSDGANALHCAVSGGSAASLEVVKLLLDASADVSAVDANGNRPIDLIVTLPNFVFNSRKRMLEAILQGTNVFDEAYLLSEGAIVPMEEQQHQEMTTPRFSKDGTEKKDYPIDLSLPDIKNGIYGTDEFRMYAFKVKPCSRAYSHDWTECPFVHPGENARRRDPRKYHYSCVPCPEFRKGSCSKGDACEYAHGIFECWLHPAQYRTRLCKDEDACTRRVCFFAHKPEELRPLYASTGSAMPSPRSYLTGASSFEMGSMSPLALGSSSVLIPAVSTPPLTPTGASSPGAGAMWTAQCNGAIPNLQLPKSRLKTTLAARDFDLDMELVEHENHRRMQQQMMESLSSPSGWNNTVSNNSPFSISLGDHAGEVNRLGGLQPTNLEDIFASFDSTILPKVQGISLDAGGSQLQSPTAIQARQNGSQQLLSYSSAISNSNMVGTPSFGVDSKGVAPSVAFNPRAAAFQRSHSFIERGLMNHHSELHSPVAASSAKNPSPSNTSDWGSPDGKLDWSIQGDELSKLRKSASFGFRASHSPLAMTTARLPENSNEPDVSWVNSLVRDSQPLESGQFSSEEPQQQLQCHNNGTETGSTWLDQFYMEHEQIVA